MHVTLASAIARGASNKGNLSGRHRFHLLEWIRMIQVHNLYVYVTGDSLLTSHIVLDHMNSFLPSECGAAFCFLW